MTRNVNLEGQRAALLNKAYDIKDDEIRNALIGCIKRTSLNTERELINALTRVVQRTPCEKLLITFTYIGQGICTVITSAAAIDCFVKASLGAGHEGSVEPSPSDSSAQDYAGRGLLTNGSSPHRYLRGQDESSNPVDSWFKPRVIFGMTVPVIVNWVLANWRDNLLSPIAKREQFLIYATNLLKEHEENNENGGGGVVSSGINVI